MALRASSSPTGAEEDGGRPMTAPTETVSAVLRAFRVELSGPLDGVIRKMEAFRDVVGDLNVMVDLEVEDEDFVSA